MVGFIAILHLPHRSVKNMKKVSRIVVLPDYQGIGIGKLLLEEVGKLYIKKGFRFAITTSHPAINKSLQNNVKWGLNRQGRMNTQGVNSGIDMSKTLSSNRLTCSWELLQNEARTM